MGIRHKYFEAGATNGCNLFTRKHGSTGTPEKLKEFRCVSDPHDDHSASCVGWDSIHHDDKLKVGTEAKDSGKCSDDQVDFIYVAAKPRGTITGGWCDVSNKGKLGDEVCVPCGGDGKTTAATTTTTVTTADTSGSANTYPKGPIKFSNKCPAGSCGKGNKCEGELAFGYLTAKGVHAAHYHDNEAGFSNHFWIFQKDWSKMGCNDAKTFQSYIYNPDGKMAAQGPILSRCAGRGDGKDPNTQEPTSYMDWPGYHGGEGTKQKGAKVGWIIASAINCKKQTIPSCESGQWYNQKAAACQTCAPANGACTDGEFMVGTCAATTNTLGCKACLAPNSSNEFCPGAQQYRVGSCGGAENGFSCNVQPTCEEGSYLADATKTAAGTCTPCDNAECKQGEFREGSCGGASNSFTCSACDNLECDATVGFEEYQTGTCSGEGNNLECNKCARAECSEGSFRSGECNADTKTFVCTVQISCAMGEFYKASTTADGSEGKATCEACPDGTYMSQGFHRLPNCEPHSECSKTDDEHTFRNATATKDVVCQTSSPCRESQYESKPIGASTPRECSWLTTCYRGSYVEAAATASADRECGTCDGTKEFSSTVNAESCTPFQFCSTDERVRAAGSSTKDLSCGPCPSRTEMPKSKHQEKYCDEITTTRTTTTSTTTTTTSVTTATDTTTTSTSTTSTSTTTPDLPPIAADFDEVDRAVVDAQINALAEHIKAAAMQRTNAEEKIELIESVPYADRTDNQNRDLIKAKSDLTEAVDKLATYERNLEDAQGMVVTLDAQELASQSTAQNKRKPQSRTTSYVVIGVAFFICVLVVGAVVVVKRSKSSSAGSEGATAAFENPFYAASAPASNDPHYADAHDGGGASGYMDVPANFDGAGGTGGTGSGTGYMDVSPNVGNDDGFSDDEEV